jgi:hypothetical protein
VSGSPKSTQENGCLGPQDNPDGIAIQAATAPISYQSNGNTVYITDNFMFMQTVNARNSYSTTAGQTYVYNSATTTSPSVDNGAPGGNNWAGHEATPTGGSAPAGFDGTGWTLPVPGSDPLVTSASYIFADSPTISVPAGITNLSSLTVGSTGGNPPVAGGDPETFTFYLMYQPAGGVWVALSSVSWGWGGNATSSNGTTLDADSLHPSDSGAAQVTQTLTGNAAFPTWTGSTQTMFGNGWQQQP